MDAGNAATHAEHLDVHAQAAHGLGQFHPQHTGTEHGQALRQCGQFEQIFIRQQARAQTFQDRHHHGSAARGDDDAFSVNSLAIGSYKNRGALKPDLGREAFSRCDGFNRFQYGPDKAFAFALYPLHDRDTINTHAIHVHPERFCTPSLMCHLSCSDQQLAGHATDTGAGGSVAAALDENNGACMCPGRPIRAHSCGAGPNDGDLHFNGCHGNMLQRCMRSLAPPAGVRPAML